MKNFFFRGTESFEYFTKKSAESQVNRFDDDLFLPRVSLKSEKLLDYPFFLPLSLLVIFTFFFLILRLSSLQLINGDKNLAFSEGNRIRKERIKPQRGLILDRNGSILARNLPTFSIVYNPQFCPAKNCELKPLEKLENFAEIKEKYEKNKESTVPFVLIGNLGRDEILSIGNLDGYAHLQTGSDQVRSYPYGALFSHVVGYLGEISKEELLSRDDLFLADLVGKAGIEKVYDRDLQGTSGYNLIEVDAAQSQRRFLSRRDPVSGRSLILTLNKDLQEVSSNALDGAEKQSGGCCGVVIVTDVRSGAILSLVSHPSFDANIFSSKRANKEFATLAANKDLPFFNRAVSGNFPPGSVFKPVIAAGALNEKVITKSTLLLAPGSLSIGSFTYGDWKPEGHGLINIESALAQSADTFFYQIGGGWEGLKGLGPEGIAKYARLFGFGGLLFIDLPEENPGLVPDPSWKLKVSGENWYLGNTYHYSIGQGDLLVTPLQIAVMTSAVANGGVIFKPYILSKIVDDDGQVFYEGKGTLIREKFVDSEVLKIVKDGMGKAAQPGGTAYPFFDFKLRVGAKTGTAEPGGEVKPHAWFTAFAPFDNPEVAVTVLVEHGGQGADIAAPVARKVLEKYFEGR